ncbi:hypothetical protein PputUW4_03186 [Pseudomonas sp. UW4]|nr:hypothetical protein PputUW4_03186 [Pseudomonas sp. UW4]
MQYHQHLPQWINTNCYKDVGNWKDCLPREVSPCTSKPLSSGYCWRSSLSPCSVAWCITPRSPTGHSRSPSRIISLTGERMTRPHD